MPVEPGRNLQHYRIVDKLGEGGMGVVWRARDTSLDREVAIKVLPEQLAGDADRLARFEREAKLLASLSHPGIAIVHGLHEHEGQRFLAMELVPGEDLAERLSRGALPLDDALRIAAELATALEAAHERGVIHRDLKPANIRLTPEGKVKVLDFGLAKALAPSEAATGSEGGSPEMSPTLTSAGTQAGMILGTAAYMSPEQAKGRPVDKRTDIWAFGVVLFEMLTGSSAFRGEDIADTMASVLKIEPDFNRLPPGTPAAVRRVLRRCLQKNPARRSRDIADVRLELEEVDLDAAAETAPIPGTAGDTAARPRSGRLVPLAAGAVLGLLLGALLGWSLLRDGAPSTGGATAEPLRRSSILAPPLYWADSIALSPDGSLLAVTAASDPPSLQLRRLDSPGWETVPGAEWAIAPFFSPDGEYIAFIADGELKKVSLRGGGREVTVLCDAPGGWRGTWDSGGWIYFAYGESRLARVREDGGDVEDLGEVGDVHSMHALPGGKGILLSIHGTDKPSMRKDTSQIAVLSTDDLTVKPVLEGGYSFRYLESGHLVFMRGGGLYAVPFDLESLEASPPAVSVLPNVWRDSIWATALYDVTLDGTLVYVSDGDVANTVPTWVDLETGKEEPTSVPPALYNTYDLSPDGTRLAIQDLNGSQDQIWIHDARRDTFTRLTVEGANSFPVWSHDGSEVFFASNRDGEDRLFRKPVDGSSPASRLLTDAQEALMETDRRWPSSVTPDGKYLVIYTWGHPQRGGDMWKVPLDGSGDPEVLLATTANEIIPEVSPDGDWLVYLSNERGDYHIVVRSLADMQQREWIVSPGSDAIWSPQGDALFFWRGTTMQLLRAAVTTGEGTFEAGVPGEVRTIEYHDASGPSLAASADGRRVLVQKPVGATTSVESPLTLVTGWGREVVEMVEAR